MQTHSTQYALLSAEQHAHFHGKLQAAEKSSDEMSTKTSRILVLVSIMWSNFRHSFSFVGKNQRLLVMVFVSTKKIYLFSLTKLQFEF